MAGHVGHGDPQQLPVGQRVPHPDVFLSTGGKQLRSAEWEDNVLDSFKVTRCDQSLFEICEVDTVNV